VSYERYVVAAYCVFCAVMAWDFVAPRLALARQLRAARLRAARARPAVDPGVPLARD
jgi:heme exporter protein D